MTHCRFVLAAASGNLYTQGSINALLQVSTPLPPPPVPAGAIGSQLTIVDIAAAPVPEPAAFVLTGLGLLLAGLRKFSSRTPA